MQHIAATGPLGRNTRKRYKYKIRKIREMFSKQDPQSRQRMTKGYEKEDGVGHVLNYDKSVGSMRLFMQNPRGLGIENGNIQHTCALEDLDQTKVDVVALPETQTNWNNARVKDKWRNTVHQLWPKALILTSSIADGDLETTYKPGGVCMIIHEAYASLVIEKGTDAQGRWVWATLAGRNKTNLTLITFYRPCDDTKGTAGPMSAWKQQYNRQANAAITAGWTADQVDNIDPRDSALADLQQLIQEKRASGNKIVVMSDMNEDAYRIKRKKLTYGKLCAQEQLYSAFYEIEEDLRPSHERGTKVIDHVGLHNISASSILQAGQLPSGMIFGESDHRGVFVDIDSRTELHTVVEEAHQRPGRRLTAKNKKWTAVYLKELQERLQKCEVHGRVKKLWERVERGNITAKQRAEFETLDKYITESMLAAEKKIPKKHKSGWSPAASRSAQTIRYLRVLKRRARGYNINQHVIRVLQRRADTEFNSNSVQEIESALRKEWKTLSKLREEAKQQRELRLQELLTASQLESDETRTRAIQNIRRAETQHKKWKRINRVCGKTKRGVNTLHVPKETTTGQEWDMISSKKEMEEKIIEQNKSHLSKSEGTPFGSGELFNLIHDKQKRGAAIESLLRGTSGWKHQMQEVEEFIEDLRQQYDEHTLHTKAAEIGNPVSYEEYRDFFKLKRESTESSNSGRHMGHYKACLQDEDITSIHIMMINIQLVCGFAGKRWKVSIAVMVAKDEGITKIHRMRIIQLLEADLNFTLACIFGSRTMRFAEEFCTMNASQYGGRRGAVCQSAVLNKVLSYEISRLLKEPVAGSELDATGCYDRMIPDLVQVTCERLGTPPEPCNMLMEILYEMVHKVRTKYGDSVKHYHSTIDKVLYGTGQGSGGSPFFWNSTADVILHGMEKRSKGCRYHSAAGRVKSERIEDIFVDDASLMATGDEEQTEQERLQINTQRHERYLHCTGGSLAAHKCFWVVVRYTWEEGRAIMEQYKEEDDDRSFTITTGQNFSERHVVKRIPPGKAYRTLGVFVAATGQQETQKEILQGKSRDWSIKMKYSNLTGEEKLLSYQRQLLMRLQYPLSCTLLTRKQLAQVQVPSLREAINALGLNSTFPRSVLYGDARYQGLEMTNLYVYQGIEKIKMYVGHIRLGSATSKLLEIERSYLELESGRGKCPLASPEVCRDSWMPKSWITTLGTFLSECDGSLLLQETRIISEQRENDRFIMDDADALFSTAEKEKIQRCRKYLQVQNLSDLCNAKGDSLERKQYAGKIARKSNLHWALQGQPSRTDWKAWRRLLDTYKCQPGIRNMRLLQDKRMGKWHTSHQHWKWRGQGRTVVDADTMITYAAVENRRRPRAEKLTTRRQRMTNMQPADVEVNHKGQVRILYTELAPTSTATNGTQVAHRSHEAYQRLMGVVTANSTLNRLTKPHTNIVAVSDGSVKSGEGSAGYVIGDAEDDEQVVEGSLPVDGAPEDMNSYRTELAGILAILLVIKTLQGKSPQCSTTVHIYCDNESAVHQVNQVRQDYRYPYSVKTANQDEYDVLSSVKAVMKQIKHNVKVEWVEGHVANPRSLAEVYNNRADRLANLHREYSSRQRGTHRPLMLPEQKVQVILGGTAYTKGIPNQVKRHFYGVEAEEYIQEKFAIGGEDMRDLDWETIRRTTQQLPITERATKAKFTYRWSYTRARGFLFNDEENDLCPLCKQKQETNAHVIRCQHVAVSEHRKEAMCDLKKNLTDIGTHKELRRIMEEVLLEEEGTRDSLMKVGDTLCREDLEGLHSRQSRIGWHNWENGWWSKAWSEYHNCQRRQGLRSKYNGENWAVRAQALVWTYVKSFWIHRNKSVHGANEEEQRQVRRMRVEAAVRRKYGERPAVGRSTVFRKPLHDMLQRSTRVMEAWMEEVETATRMEIHRQRNIAKSNNSIRRYMVKRPREGGHESADARAVRQRMLDTG